MLLYCYYHDNTKHFQAFATCAHDECYHFIHLMVADTCPTKTQVKHEPVAARDIPFFAPEGTSPHHPTAALVGQMLTQMLKPPLVKAYMAYLCSFYV